MAICQAYFTPNMDFSQNGFSKRSMLQTVKGFSHEYKAIVLWHLLTKHDVVPGKRQLISQKIKEMLEEKDVYKMYDIAKGINALYTSEELFGIRYEHGTKKDFAYGDCTFNRFDAHC